MKKIEERISQIKAIERSFLWMEKRLLREIKKTSEFMLKNRNRVQNPAIHKFQKPLEKMKRINREIKDIVKAYYKTK
jgi:hypothetical protein